MVGNYAMEAAMLEAQRWSDDKHRALVEADCVCRTALKQAIASQVRWALAFQA